MIEVHVSDDDPSHLLGFDPDPAHHLLGREKALELRTPGFAGAGVYQGGLAAGGANGPHVIVDLHVFGPAGIEKQHGQLAIKRSGKVHSEDFIIRFRSEGLAARLLIFGHD